MPGSIATTATSGASQRGDLPRNMIAKKLACARLVGQGISTNRSMLTRHAPWCGSRGTAAVLRRWESSTDRQQIASTKAAALRLSDFGRSGTIGRTVDPKDAQMQI